MINWLIEVSLRHRFLVIAFFPKRNFSRFTRDLSERMGEITKKVSASRESLCSTVQVEREANDMEKSKKRIGSVSIALLVLSPDASRLCG